MLQNYNIFLIYASFSSLFRWKNALFSIEVQSVNVHFAHFFFSSEPLLFRYLYILIYLSFLSLFTPFSTTPYLQFVPLFVSRSWIKLSFLFISDYYWCVNLSNTLCILFIFSDLWIYSNFLIWIIYVVYVYVFWTI